MLKVAQRLMKRKKEVKEIFSKTTQVWIILQTSLWADMGWDGAGVRIQLLRWSGQKHPPELGLELKLGFV